jgi:hypothetical protein
MAQSLAQRLRERAKERDKFIDQQKVQRKIVNPMHRHLTVEEMEHKLQMAEAEKRGMLQAMKEMGQSPLTQLVIPQQNGQLVNAAEHTMNQRAIATHSSVMDELRWSYRETDKEPLVEVTSFLTYDYESAVNMVRYVVPALSRKMLPQSLAAHFQEKTQHLERNAAFENVLGGYDGPGTAPAVGYNHARRESEYFAGGGNAVEPSQRLRIY